MHVQLHASNGEDCTTDTDKTFNRKLKKSSHYTHNRNTKDFTRKCTFHNSLDLWQMSIIENFIMYAIKTISKFATHLLVKTYMKLKRTNLLNPCTRATMNFLLKLLIFRIILMLTISRMKTLIGQQLFPQMGFLFHTKLILELNVMLFF